MTLTLPDRVNDDPIPRPDPQVPERARRRTFTAKYKLRILAEYAAADDGEKGALLRREGLYSSHIVVWRRARDTGALAGLTASRGRPRNDAAAEQIARLQAEKKQLELELAKARFVVDVQAKLHALLETISESACSFACTSTTKRALANSNSSCFFSVCNRAICSAAESLRGRPRGAVNPASAPASRARRHTAIWLEYNPSRRSNAPFSPSSAAS